jgi:hypothetical protein
MGAVVFMKVGREQLRMPLLQDFPKVSLFCRWHAV